MINPADSYQSTSQEPQTGSSTGINMVRDTAKTQSTDDYKQVQYTDVHRVWSTNASTYDGNSQTETQGFLISASATNAESLTPMERWAAESSGQAPWNPISSINTSLYNIETGHSDNSVHHQEKAGDDWSICGNPSTK
ncbi:predicted protein [Sclerotinia sclerotiorum 1980 UF-70]|uniref:Uncharacterized protein n=2 Tax=Sclerotinia sclerotiorum (strain ATCC 18683 / 1980 / Ss-1) TaxID=665079 RepID=A7F7W2_SCLS1|nr:predicted protein [Sclerotinia sclerotiorum 1980 UF-70]APA14971.1 hypothetical protein sscle_14g097410 [Sclerotinia sclerotiorum 1980 UF-70]EDN98833.1 predicted protein [Sclerotinia sclerotiorum 1980 UF-70]